MKALQIIKYGELKDGLAINETAKPSSNATSILIQTKAASLNPIDYKLVSGGLKDMVPLDLPSSTGFDVSGIIVEKGTEVTGFEVGDAVYARVPQQQMGTVAEFVAVESTVVSKKPENISFEEAASLPLIGLTSIQALERVGLNKNDRILIHAGSGGVGSFAIQYAKAKGAYVYTTTSTKNVHWVKSLGADRVIDYKKEDYKSIVSDLDLVFDTLGGDYTLDAFQVIKEGGKVTSIAGVPDEETAAMMGIKGYELPENLARLIKEKSANYKLTWMQPNGEQLDEISVMVKEGRIKPIIDKVYPFAEGIEAYLYLATGRAKGKVIISMS
ncbi:NADP-dependent oxidoreductase [Roseivirga echinicomitans]|uniref:NADPH:quinone reductase n=1 Tax=Roseivirga echinicomitans TaxID=296218 RepID=A0A150XQ10_9BACT|nr:NADP-dependent oxidoreductase [Roseivirga echinicomitans]KYG80781.1 NADPH:quinone reductase [Roseivirga echinicomitans]